MSNMAPPTNDLKTHVIGMIEPLYLLFLSFSCLPRTILSSPNLLFHPKQLQSQWFANLWTFLGPQMALSPIQIPYIADLFSRAKGTVLELGPGSGDQMRHILPAVQSGQVERVVGAEPNVGLHARLRASAKGVGLDPAKGKYIVLEAGAEPASLIPALHRARLYPTSTSEYTGSRDGEGVFDTIICIKSMCSAPQHQLHEIASTVHGLLKPGGEFLFFEHVGNVTDPITMVWAWLLNWIWPIAMGNCHLNGSLDRVVKDPKIGKWTSIEVRNADEFMGWNVFRYVIGVCKK